MRTSEDDEARRSCIKVAAEFIAAQPGGVARILTVHRPRHSGSCAGCAHMATPWPCTAATIAHPAQGLPKVRTQRSVIDVVDDQAATP